MLKVNHVQKSYSHFHLDCSLEIKRGSITGIIGKNGSGKTTLFKAILNLIHIDSGALVSATSYAREQESRTKMDSSQLTGAACSYAGKRALGNLFAIDDTADADTYGEQQNEQSPNGRFIGACTACGTQYYFDSELQMNNSFCQCGNTEFRRV